MKVQLESLRLELQHVKTSGINAASNDGAADRLSKELTQQKTANQHLQQEIVSLQQQQNHRAHQQPDASALGIMEETLIHYRQTIEQLQQVCFERLEKLTLVQHSSSQQGEMLNQNALLAQRAVEMERLQAQNQSLTLQLRSSSGGHSYGFTSNNRDNAGSPLFDHSGSNMSLHSNSFEYPNQQLEKVIL
jgi:hypothetical protein